MYCKIELKWFHVVSRCGVEMIHTIIYNSIYKIITSQVVSRWWAQFMSLPWPDTLARWSKFFPYVSDNFHAGERETRREDSSQESHWSQNNIAISGRIFSDIWQFTCRAQTTFPGEEISLLRIFVYLLRIFQDIWRKFVKSRSLGLLAHVQSGIKSTSSNSWPVYM